MRIQCLCFASFHKIQSLQKDNSLHNIEKDIVFSDFDRNYFGPQFSYLNQMYTICRRLLAKVH